MAGSFMVRGNFVGEGEGGKWGMLRSFLFTITGSC